MLPNVSVGSELRRLFPFGTRLGSTSWDRVPLLPVDVFAAAAHLLSASGAHQRVAAPFGGASAYAYHDPMFAASPAEIADWTSKGDRWARGANISQTLAEHWKVLTDHEGARLVKAAIDPTPAWWRAAYALLVISDEACVDLGYLGVARARPAGRWANTFYAGELEDATERTILRGHDASDDRHLSRHVALDSLTALASRDVARVLPKGRTTELGCNMRTLSHNLALLPPHGYGNAYWHQTQPASPRTDDAACNLLLVPYPFVVGAGCFEGGEANGPHGERWGRFKVKQRWLSDGGDGKSTVRSRAALVAFVDALIERAHAAGTPISGVLLPEYALDWETYDELVRHLRDHRADVEFVVSGVSSDCAGRVGNLVTSSVMLDPDDGSARQVQTHSRQKHHRWRIERSQIEGYNLEADLDADVIWWEHLPIEERVLHVDAFRSGSTLTAVICEDLARVEPGLTLLRALGPSLVFALLMDGAQVKARWPGTYATAMTDDPGSSVLSFTSLGLVSRSIAKRKRGDEPIVALWKNRPRPSGPRTTDYVELSLKDAHAVVLEMRSERAGETTLDGRRNDDATAWYLEQHSLVAIEPDRLHREGWEWIVA